MFFKEAVHYNAGYQIRQSNLMCSIGLIFVSAMSDGYDIVSITLWKGWWWCVFCECECEVRGGCDALSLCGCGASTWMEATSPPTLLWRLFLRTFPLTYYIGITCPTIVEECYTLCRRLQQTLGVINDTSDILLRVNRHISAEVEVMMTFSMTTTLSMARILLTK